MDHAKQETLWEGRFLRLLRRGRWEYADRHNATGAVVLVAVTDDGRLLLTEQFRVPLQAPVIELPAGLVGDMPGEPGDDLEAAARRELREETGYEARRLRVLMQGPTSAGLSTEVVTLFHATGLTRVGRGGGVEHEQITTHEVPLSAAHTWLLERIAAGVAVDPKVFAGLYFAQRAAEGDAGARAQ